MEKKPKSNCRSSLNNYNLKCNKKNPNHNSRNTDRQLFPEQVNSCKLQGEKLVHNGFFFHLKVANLTYSRLILAVYPHFVNRREGY